MLLAPLARNTIILLYDLRRGLGKLPYTPSPFFLPNASILFRISSFYCRRSTWPENFHRSKLPWNLDKQAEFFRGYLFACSIFINLPPHHVVAFGLPERRTGLSSEISTRITPNGNRESKKSRSVSRRLLRLSYDRDQFPECFETYEI